jgi:hypothetical protein
MKTVLSLLALVAVVLLLPDALFAQPPGLPGAPSQAPIDGGLGLLAAGGAAYAWKKLRNKPNA